MTSSHDGSPSTTRTEHLVLTDGTIGYDTTGSGPLILCVPGMGQLRRSFRALVPLLVAAGHEVATADLRGHGDSTAEFRAYGDGATASDIIALLQQLGRPAVVIGHSMAAGAAVIAAAERPDLVTGLVLVGPFVRDQRISPVARAVLRVAMAPRWARIVWNSYLPKLYAGNKPHDLATHRAAVDSALRQPGHSRAFSRTTRLSHAEAERVLDRVTAPSLVVMGELDPDFPDPAGEAAWIADRLHGERVMVPESGHYPQEQQPGIVADAVLRFLGRMADRG
jgi:pimeloyl-ACP methyl ester carboxylesterase